MSKNQMTLGTGMGMILVCLLVVQSNAFSTYTQPSPSRLSTTRSDAPPTSTKMVSFSNLPKIFNDNSPPDDDEDEDTPPPSFLTSPTDPESLLRRTKEILSTNLAIDDPSLLSPSFTWIGPDFISEGPLSKREYLAAGKFFYLPSTFPDLNYRAHDFRIDTSTPLTVRLTARTVGTMRGELRLRNEILPPNGRKMVCPPEAISVTFDGESGLCTRICTGFVMDRTVGNTGGLGGVKAAATVAGAPPSEWEIYPPAQVVGRFFGRPVKGRDEPDVFLAPFPETVMIQLAKGVLAARGGVEDPTLLAEDFMWSGPKVGPLGKKAYLGMFEKINLKTAFPDLVEDYRNFRVDPYDPYRVWFDSKTEGTWTGPLAGKVPNGNKFRSPIESNSLTFDDDGFCTRITAGYPMDPTDSNTGGLGGLFGIYYALGIAPLPIRTRTLPQIIARTQTAALSLFTGADVDNFDPQQQTQDDDDDDTDEVVSNPLSSIFQGNAESPNDDDDDPAAAATAAREEIKQQRIQKQEEFAAKREAEKEQAAQARAEAFKKREAASRAQKENAAAAAAAAAKEKQVESGGGAKKKMGIGIGMGKAKSKETANKQQPVKKVVVTKAKAKAPKGVPVLKRWRKNRDESITGFITGSPSFSEGEKVTTSPIARGELKSGNVVQTESGSKYFLN